MIFYVIDRIQNVSADKLLVFRCVALLLRGLKVHFAPGNVSFPLADKGNSEDDEESRVHCPAPKAVRPKQDIILVNETFESVLQKVAAFSHLFLAIDAFASDGIPFPVKARECAPTVRTNNLFIVGEVDQNPLF